jgi:hypothetical protein
MSIDTAAITDSVTTVINQALDFLPIGIAVVGIPAAIAIGLGFAGKLVNYIKSGFGGK